MQTKERERERERERENQNVSMLRERDRMKKSTLMLIFSALVSCYFVLFPRRPSSLCVAISSSLFNNKAQARIKWRQEQKEREHSERDHVERGT
jgi:hypothetical protein